MVPKYSVPHASCQESKLMNLSSNRFARSCFQPNRVTHTSWNSGKRSLSGLSFTDQIVLILAFLLTSLIGHIACPEEAGTLESSTPTVVTFFVDVLLRNWGAFFGAYIFRLGKLSLLIRQFKLGCDLSCYVGFCLRTHPSFSFKSVEVVCHWQIGSLRAVRPGWFPSWWMVA